MKTAPTETRTETRAGPAVVDGTISDDAARDLADAVRAADVDPRVFTGAFATNVWGGRFAVDGVLGTGAQGTTFSGRDLKTDGRVAIKVFDIARAKDWKAQELFEREVQTLKTVEHAGIPKLLDVIVDDDTGARALVRTLIPGDSLKDVVAREGALREAALWHVIVDAADVLGALHSRPSPIVHRDIKPSNLIRQPDGKVCLVDFGGVGRARGEAGSTVVGTFGYMAPEQLYGAQTPATDMYSLGATLLALATAQEPEDLPRDGLKLDVDKAAPQLSPKLRALIAKMVAPDPKDRPQDAQHLLGALKDIAADVDADAPNERDADHARFLDELGSVDAAGRLNAAPVDGGDIFVGVVSLVFGVLGVAGAVVVGQVLLPFIITILAALSTSPEQREKLHRARERVRAAARQARGGFEGAALHGAKRLEAVGERDKARRVAEKRARKEKQRRRREEAREVRHQRRRG